MTCFSRWPHTQRKARSRDMKCSSRSLTAPDIKPRYNRQELILAVFPIYADIPDQLVNRGTSVRFDPACFSNSPLTLNNAVTTVRNQAGLLRVSPRPSCSPLPGRGSRQSIKNPLKEKSKAHWLVFTCLLLRLFSVGLCLFVCQPWWWRTSGLSSPACRFNGDTIWMDG